MIVWVKTLWGSYDRRGAGYARTDTWTVHEQCLEWYVLSELAKQSLPEPAMPAMRAASALFSIVSIELPPTVCNNAGSERSEGQLPRHEYT